MMYELGNMIIGVWIVIVAIMSPSSTNTSLLTIAFIKGAGINMLLFVMVRDPYEIYN